MQSGAVLITLAAGAAVAAIGLGWRAGGDGTPARISVAEADLARGAEVYAENCAACHGADLGGAPNWRTSGPDGVMPAPPHDETGHTWHHDDGLLFRYTKLGGKALLAERGITDFKSGMPGFGDVLSDSEIVDVLAFIKSRWPERERGSQAAVTEQAVASQ